MLFPAIGAGVFVVLVWCGLVVWEVRAERSGQPLPSAGIRLCLDTIRRWTETFGLWIARLLNPLYYLEFVLPYLRPYFEAVKRIVVACSPVAVPGYFFLRGFFKEHHGWLTMAVSTIFVIWQISDAAVRESIKAFCQQHSLDLRALSASGMLALACFGLYLEDRRLGTESHLQRRTRSHPPPLEISSEANDDSPTSDGAPPKLRRRRSKTPGRANRSD